MNRDGRRWAGWLLGVSMLGCQPEVADRSEPSDLFGNALCEDGDPARERHGTDCACCHQEFGVSGSVALAAVGGGAELGVSASQIEHVIIDDAAGGSFDLPVNAYGNFFRHIEPTPPLRARVVYGDGSVVAMQGDADAACNGCHRDDAEAGLLGAPSRD